MSATGEKSGVFSFENPAEERAFQDAATDRFARLARVLPIVGIGAFAAYLPFDSLSSRHYELTLWRGVIIAAFIALWVGSYHSKLRPNWTWVLQATFQVGLFGTLWLNTLMQGTSPYGLGSTSFALNMIALMVAGALIAPLPFRHALVACGMTAIAYPTLVVALTPMATVDILGNTFNVSFVAVACCVASAVRERLLRALHAEQVALRNERNLLSVILSEIVPTQVALSIRQGRKVAPRAFGEVSILFADLVGFTQLSTRIGPKHLVEVLDDLFTEFDALVEKRHVEKVKTIGDAYMVVGGAREENEDVVLETVRLGFDMIDATRALAERMSLPIELRVGVHLGSVIGGVIGRTRMAFDYWGDAVNLASRLESNGVPGAVQVSEAVVMRLRGRLTIAERRTVELKGKGAVEAYLLRPGVHPSEDVLAAPAVLKPVAM